MRRIRNTSHKQNWQEGGTTQRKPHTIQGTSLTRGKTQHRLDIANVLRKHAEIIQLSVDFFQQGHRRQKRAVVTQKSLNYDISFFLFFFYNRAARNDWFEILESIVPTRNKSASQISSNCTISSSCFLFHTYFARRYSVSTACHKEKKIVLIGRTLELNAREI